MAEYLVHGHDKWHIAVPGAIIDCQTKCQFCKDGLDAGLQCKVCAGVGTVGDGRVRLAWFDRDDHGLIAYDKDDPEVREMPE